MNNIEWLKSRQSLITATDSLFILKEFNEQISSKLIGINTWNRTRFQLYTEKMISCEQYLEYQEVYKKLYPEKAKTMQEGKDRESEIAGFAKSDLSFELEANGDNIITKDEYKIGATPDYYTNFIEVTNSPHKLPDNYIVGSTIEDIDCEISRRDSRHIAFEDGFNIEEVKDTKGIIECKLTSPIDGQSIKTYKEDNPESSDLSDEEIKEIIWNNKLLAYQFQVQHQLLCTNLQWAVIAIGIKENREINSPITKRHYHFIKANPKLQQAIIDGVSNFWKWFENVKANRELPPQWDYSNEKDAVLYTIIRNDIEKMAEEFWRQMRDIRNSNIPMMHSKIAFKPCSEMSATHSI